MAGKASIQREQSVTHPAVLPEKAWSRARKLDVFSLFSWASLPLKVWLLYFNVQGLMHAQQALYLLKHRLSLLQLLKESTFM